MKTVNTDLANERSVSFEEEYPSLRRRFVAITIDSFVIIATFLVAGQMIELVGLVPGYVRGMILVVILLTYDPIFVSFLSGTIGHKLMRMKIVDVKTKGNIPVHKAMIRFVVKGLLGWISFLSVSFNPAKRAIHDFWSNSMVVNR